MADADRAYVKEFYRLTRTIDKLTCGQVRIDHSCDQERAFYLFITPDDGCYKGATCKFKVSVPETYPAKAPNVTCLNSIYHPNIDIGCIEDEVCVNLLDSDWQPGVGLDGCIMAVLYLFHHPNPEDALSPVFDGSPMNETEFMENVRASLRGGIVDGFRFDQLINNNMEEGYGVNSRIYEPLNKDNEISQEENGRMNQTETNSMNKLDTTYVGCKVNEAFTKHDKEKGDTLDEVDKFVMDDNKADKATSIMNDFIDQNPTEMKDTIPQDISTIKQKNNVSDAAVINDKTKHFYLQMLALFERPVTSLYSQIWHKMLNILNYSTSTRR